MPKVGPDFAAEVFLRGGSLVQHGYRVTVNTKLKTYYVRALNKFEKNPELTKEQLAKYLLTSEWFEESGCKGLHGWTMYKKANGEMVYIPAVAACVGEKRREQFKK